MPRKKNNLTADIRRIGALFITRDHMGIQRRDNPKDLQVNTVNQIGQSYLTLLKTRWLDRSNPIHRQAAEALEAHTQPTEAREFEADQTQAQEKGPAHKRWLFLVSEFKKCNHGKFSNSIITLFGAYFGELERSHPYAALTKSTQVLADEMNTKINDYFNSLSTAKKLQEYNPNSDQHWLFLTENLAELPTHNRLSRAMVRLFENHMGTTIDSHKYDHIKRHHREKTQQELADEIKAVMDLQQASDMGVYGNAIELRPLPCSAAAEPELAPPPQPLGEGPQALNPAAEAK
jgi:hypothetical protein